VDQSSTDLVTQLDDALRDIMRLGGEAGASLSRKIRQLTGVKAAPAAIAVLVELKGTALRLSRLAESVGLAQPTVTVYVQDLERKDLIARTRDESDRRGWILELTDRGRETVELVDRIRRAEICSMLAEWSESDIASLSNLLSRFREDLTRAVRSTVALGERASDDGADEAGT
jgi:DNA-binding MarR family transcriptional regulator